MLADKKSTEKDDKKTLATPYVAKRFDFIHRCAPFVGLHRAQLI